MFNMFKKKIDLNRLLINELDRRVEDLERLLVVYDYFNGCPNSKNGKKIFRYNAKKFRKLEAQALSGVYYANGWGCHENSYFTSQENYEIHKSEIAKWEKEYQAYLKKIKNK